MSSVSLLSGRLSSPLCKRSAFRPHPVFFSPASLFYPLFKFSLFVWMLNTEKLIHGWLYRAINNNHCVGFPSKWFPRIQRHSRHYILFTPRKIKQTKGSICTRPPQIWQRPLTRWTARLCEDYYQGRAATGFCKQEIIITPTLAGHLHHLPTQLPQIIPIPCSSSALIDSRPKSAAAAPNRSFSARATTWW